MNQPVTHAPLGSIGWTERTGGVLTVRERISLAPPLLRSHLSIVVGRLAMATRTHSGRRNSIGPDALVPPDSLLAREAEAAAQDLLTPALLNHSRFEEEVLYPAAIVAGEYLKMRLAERASIAAL